MNILLIPGAGGDKHYWDLVVPHLSRRGWRVVPTDLPAGEESAGIPEYVDAVLEQLGQPDGELVVVAQSLGAFTAVALAERVPVSLLIFVAAMIPSPGETAGEWWDETGQGTAQRELDLAEGRDPDAPFDAMTTFLHDVPAAVVEELFARGETPQSGGPFGSPMTATAWRSVPTRVVAGSRDRFFPIGFMRALSIERLGIDPDEIDAGHLVALSRPSELAALIAGFVDATARNDGP